MTNKKRLGELILDAGLITDADLNKALRLQVGGTRRLGYILIKMGFISEEALQTILSRQLGLPIINVDHEFDPEVRKILPRYLCRKYSVIPLRIGDNNTLTVAMVDPSDNDAVSDIEQYTGRIIQPVLASKSAISAGIRARIPWSLRDIFNSRTSSLWTAAAAALALFMIIVIAAQFYQDRQAARYGKVSHAANSTTYENLELILGFDARKNVTLIGRGAYSSGYYSVTFNDTQALKHFLNAKKDDFSAQQLEWLAWAMANPRDKK